MRSLDISSSLVAPLVCEDGVVNASDFHINLMSLTEDKSCDII